MYLTWDYVFLLKYQAPLFRVLHQIIEKRKNIVQKNWIYCDEIRRKMGSPMKVEKYWNKIALEINMY